MSRTDLIADMLTMVRNASSSKKEKVDVPASRINEEILRVLKEHGFIENYRKMDGVKVNALRVYLKYANNQVPVLTNLKRISKSGLRVYTKKKNIRRVKGGMGMAIVSTSKGVMSDKQAREAGVGGEILCYAW